MTKNTVNLNDNISLLSLIGTSNIHTIVVRSISEFRRNDFRPYDYRRYDFIFLRVFLSELIFGELIFGLMPCWRRLIRAN